MADRSCGRGAFGLEITSARLQRVYRSVKQPMSRRMRAAIEALPKKSRSGAITAARIKPIFGRKKEPQAKQAQGSSSRCLN